MHPFLRFIRTYYPMQLTDWRIAEKKLSFLELSKHSILLEEGSICRHLYFLEEGLLRYYFLKDGLEITKYFTEAPYVFTSQRSFSLQIPSVDSIQAIEHSKIWALSFDDVQELWGIPAWSQFARKIINEVQFYTEEIYADLQTVNAEDRYQKMMIEVPDLLQRIPLKYLASYLGIAPQSLSRIRKKMKAIPPNLT